MEEDRNSNDKSSNQIVTTILPRVWPPPSADRAVFHLIIEGGMAAAKQKYPDAFYKNGNFHGGPHAELNALRAFDFFVRKVEAYAKVGLIDEDDPQIAARMRTRTHPPAGCMPSSRRC